MYTFQRALWRATALTNKNRNKENFPRENAASYIPRCSRAGWRLRGSFNAIYPVTVVDAGLTVTSMPGARHESLAG